MALKAKPAPRPGKTGRPSLYSLALAAEICRRLARGATLVAICRQERMPHYDTVLRWSREHDEFRRAYARAREDQAYYWADEVIDISDSAERDFRDGGDGAPAFDSEHVQRSRLRADNRKWLASKFAPKVFGEKLALEASGPGGGPIETKTTLDVSKLSPSQLAALASIRLPQKL
jgi:hypothetical protein